MRADQYWRFDNGWVVAKVTARWWQVGGLAGGLVAGLLIRRRRAILAEGVLGATVGCALYVPPVCTLLVYLLVEPWILLRLSTIL